MSFKKGDIITVECGCIGVFDKKNDSRSVVSIWLYKCGSDAHQILKIRTNFAKSRLSTAEEINEFKKALIKEGLYYRESNKTVIVNNEF